MPEVYANGAQASLALAIGPADTMLAVDSAAGFVDASGSPLTGPFHVVVADLRGGTVSSPEVMLVTAISGASLSVVRAREYYAGTKQALAHPVGCTVSLVLTAESMQALTGTAVQGAWFFATSAVMADPGSGNMRFNAATAAATTAIAISTHTADNIDYGGSLRSLVLGDSFYLQDRDNAANWVRYDLSGPPVDNGAWLQIPVALHAPTSFGGSLPANGANVFATFARSGTVALKDAVNVFTVGPQTIKTGAPATVGLIVQGAASQSADLQQWQDATGAVLMRVNPSGFLAGAAAAAGAGAAGGGLSLFAGNGSGTGSGGAGGTLTLAGGSAQGDNTVDRSGGAAGLQAGSSRGGAAGAAANVTGGNGGVGTAATGAAGGTVQEVGGIGGGNVTGGPGGAALLTGGQGGSGTTTRGDGGSVYVSGGSVGSGAGTGGTSGGVVLHAGAPGTGAAGSVQLTTSAATAGAGTKRIEVNDTGLGFFGVSPVAQPSGDIGAALVSLGLMTSPTGGGGTTILSGAGAPTAGTGAIGNYYEDTAAAVFYGPKGGLSEYLTVAGSPNANHLNFEYGVRVQFARAGQITRLRYTRGSGFQVTIPLNVYDSGGTLVATVNDSQNTPGTYEAVLSTPVNVAAGATCTVSYYAGGSASYITGLQAVTNTQDMTFLGFYNSAGGFPNTSTTTESYPITPGFVPTDPWPVAVRQVPVQRSLANDPQGLMLQGDFASPGNSMLYGTNASGAKGWYAQPAGGSAGPAAASLGSDTLTPVAPATFPTWFNQGSAAVSDSGTWGFALKDATDNAGSIRGVLKSAPADGGVGWVITAKLRAPTQPANYWTAALVLTDGTKFLVFGTANNLGTTVQQWTSATAFSTAVFNGDGALPLREIWLQVVYNGSTLACNASPDGLVWQTRYSQAYNAFLATKPTSVGVGGQVNTPGLDWCLELHSYREEPNTTTHTVTPATTGSSLTQLSITSDTSGLKLVNDAAPGNYYAYGANVSGVRGWYLGVWPNVANVFTLGPQTFQTGAAGNVGVLVKGAASQTGDLQQWQDSTNAVLSRIDNAGAFRGGTGTTGTTGGAGASVTLAGGTGGAGSTTNGAGGAITISGGAVGGGAGTGGSSGSVAIKAGNPGTGSGGSVQIQNSSGLARIQVNDIGIGFFGGTTTAKPTVTGSRGGNAALASLLTALATLGLLTDSTTA